ncbi:ClpXP protease specificity-enhancing factor [Imhoffiella purpurea]|nr:ClpXP protease specificity-enhancing factor [Imhoffiella purpurea]
MTSSKPYLIRAIYEWILDNRMTPHLVVDANYPDASVPQEFVDGGRIVLNISPGAVRGLVIGNDWIQFGARFNGVAREIMAPSEAVIGIFTRENGQGMVFPDPHYPSDETDAQAPSDGPALKPVEDSGGSAPKGESGDDSGGKGKGRGGPTLKLVK